MGVLDEFRSSFGETALDPTTGPGTQPANWQPICVCGHLQKHHAPTIGGTFAVLDPTEKTVGEGRRFVHIQVAEGCRGAMVNRGQPTVHDERVETTELITRTETFLSTCPCDDFREVAKVDRPNRFFNQRIPLDRTDAVRHPFQVGIRAFSTFLSRRRWALADPTWAAAEFDRRFQWTARRCAVSNCATTDDVWPVFVSGNRSGLSELRCPAHR